MLVQVYVKEKNFSKMANINEAGGVFRNGSSNNSANYGIV